MDALLMPPLSCFLVGGAGYLLRKRQPTLSKALVAAAVASLVLLSLPLVSSLLLRSLQRFPALANYDPSVRAIVVLAGDANSSAPEYGGATCGPMTLERVRYGAYLARATKLPLLVSGGPPTKGVRAHADMMKEALERDFGLDVRWIEPHSATTRDNARRSVAILRRDGIDRAYLVTHAWHMPRAVGEFEACGLSIVPAPTGFRAAPTLEWGTFTPSAKALRESAWALHEWIGRIWYALVP